MTRLVQFGCGRDIWRGVGLLLTVAVFPRRAPEGEICWRLLVQVHLSRRCGVRLYVTTVPAWTDEPSAVAEFRRSM